MVDIAIVGGGPGGLLTAWHLNKKVGSTCTITVFEASERTGGKLVTRRFDAPGGLYEAGVAEFYDYSFLGYDPLREMITETLGLSTVPMDSEAVAVGDTLIPFYTDLPATLGKKAAKDITAFRKRCASLLSPAQYYEGIGRDDNEHPWMELSQEDVLFNEVKDDVARHYLKIAAHSDVAISPAHTSGLNALKNHLMDIDGYIGLYSIVGGNDLFVKGLAEKVQADILLRTPVRRIEKAGEKYRLTFRQNSTEMTRDFDAVAVCLPMNWLMTLEWAGEDLQRALSAHIDHFNYPAHYLRVTIAFKEKFWTDAFGNQSWMMHDSFNGCCIYDESSRHEFAEGGALGWLIAGHDALAFSALPDAALVRLALDSLPQSLRHGAELMVASDVQRWPYSVNGIPGGRPVRPVRATHVPEPKKHPGIVLIGDYLFDATLNGVLDSADCASDILVSQIIERDYDEFLVKQGRPPKRDAKGRMVPAPLDADFFADYRKSGPYAEAYSKFFDAELLRDWIGAVYRPKKKYSLLDVGSASGLTVKALRALGIDARGIESNPVIHRQTPEDMAKYNLLGDITRLPFEDQSFDYVHESCLCFLPEKKIGKALKELRRVAKRGVIFGSITSDLDVDIMDRYELQRGIRKLATWWEWSELFFNAGFDLAIEDETVLQTLWARTIAAGKGPGQWYEDAESLRFSFYAPVEDDED